LRIKEIELDNFKSFGKHTLVPLLGGFTTISGPNGSGKSNVIDSLLFALGLSSTRSMRAERLPDLLNNLSGRNEAKVTVRFTNDAGEEIEVMRRIKVKENGYVSSYFLNGRGSSLTDIHEELMKYNVSPTGFNVIMQGDVTGIVTMSAGERRKIIDELAGVAEFDRRIEQAGTELQAVAEKIEHQKIILEEIVKRLEVLKGDRDQALKYLELKEQKETVEKDLIFVRAQDLQAKIDSEIADIEKLNAKEKKLLEKHEQTEIALLSLRAEMARIDQEIKEKGGNEQLLLRQELENTRGELTREENKLSNLNAVIGEKNKLLKNIQTQIKSIDKRVADLTRQRKQHLEDQQAVRLGLMEKQGAFSAVMAELDVLRQQKDRSSDRVTTLHLDLQKLRDEKHRVEVRKTELTTRRSGLDKENDSLRQRLAELIEKSGAMKHKREGSELSFQDHGARVAGIERTIQQLEAELKSTEEELEIKRQALEAVNRRVIQLETTKEVAGESGFGKAVEAILAKQIPGVHGTIGQLGKVDDAYTVALETAIGSRLAHIVVDTDEVAQQCIELLKKTHAGRATFVPLNKIVTQPPGLLPNHPGVIDFAYNLIDFHPKFTKAFQYACGQTVVVDNMEVARKLINQARMVTKEGELFEKTGTMTGGQEKSRMHFSNKGESDLTVVKQTANTLNDQLRWLKETVVDLNAGLSDEREKLNSARSEHAHKLSELESGQKQALDMEKEIEELKPRLRKNAEEMEAIDSDVSSMESSLKDAAKHIGQLEEELNEVIGAGGTSATDKFVQESEDLRADIDSIEAELQEIQRCLDKCDTEMNVEQNNQAGLTAQAQELNKEIEEAQALKPEHEQKIEGYKQSISDMEKKVKDLSTELEDMRAEKEKAHEAITAGEVAKTKIDQDLIHLNEQRQERKLLQFDLLKDLTALQEEIERLKTENPNYEPPSAANVEQLKTQVERLEKRMRALEPVNMKALEEYNQTDERQKELNEHLLTLTNEKEEIILRINGYDELKKRTFLETFEAINLNFQEIFAELSHGHGRLELENPERPFEGGLIIRAQPRDKKMQRIEALSGGEKSLTALSFVFAFQRYAPAPFYAFDEVDMMLDGSNAERLARMVKRQSESAQFVVVSLRRPMIENADHAIGVSLRADGYSRVVGIREVHIPEVHVPEEDVREVQVPEEQAASA
jgi:chromosome segregation protein